jgi:hypothetical protein
MLSAIMLNVVMLSVVAPFTTLQLMNCRDKLEYYITWTNTLAYWAYSYVAKKI